MFTSFNVTKKALSFSYCLLQQQSVHPLSKTFLDPVQFKAPWKNLFCPAWSAEPLGVLVKCHTPTKLRYQLPEAT